MGRRRLLALSARPDSPGQRFRIKQWARGLGDTAGIDVVEHPFSNAALSQLLDQPGQRTRKALELARSLASYRARAPRGSFDASLIYREAVPVGPVALETKLIDLDLPLAFDLDDPIFLGNHGSAQPSLSILRSSTKWKHLSRRANIVIAINEQIAGVVGEYAPRVEVIPNALDLGRYAVTPSEERGPTCIGFSGSPSTMGSLASIAEPLRRVAAERSVVLRVMGGTCPMRSPGLPVEEVRWTAESEAAALQSFDIGVAPAFDDCWSRYKFPVKVLLYMAVGRPVLASPLGSVREIIEDGVNGLLAESTEEWVEKLLALADDPDLRKSLGRAGRRTVEQRFSLEVTMPRVSQLFSELVAGGIG